MTSVNYLHYSINCVPIYSLGNGFLLPGQTQCPYTADVIYPPRSCYCIFPVNTLLILKEEEKSRATKLRHCWIWAAQLISCQRCTLSLMMMTHDLSSGGGEGTQGFYIHINILTMCCVPAALLTKWVTDSSRWLKTAYEWFVGLIRHLVVDSYKRSQHKIDLLTYVISHSYIIYMHKELWWNICTHTTCTSWVPMISTTTLILLWCNDWAQSLSHKTLMKISWMILIWVFWTCDIILKLHQMLFGHFSLQWVIVFSVGLKSGLRDGCSTSLNSNLIWPIFYKWCIVSMEHQTTTYLLTDKDFSKEFRGNPSLIIPFTYPKAPAKQPHRVIIPPPQWSKAVMVLLGV